MMMASRVRFAAPPGALESGAADTLNLVITVAPSVHSMAGPVLLTDPRNMFVMSFQSVTLDPFLNLMVAGSTSMLTLVSTSTPFSSTPRKRLVENSM